MSCKRFALLFICFSVFAWFLAQAGAPGLDLVRQGGTNQINEINEHLFMRWSHGAYLAMDGLAGGPYVFYTVGRDGEWTHTAQFRNPEGTRFYVFAYDRQSDGTIVFSGQTEAEVVSPFLAWTSADGKIQRMLGTGHYFAYELAVAPDDTIWTLGHEMVNMDDNDPAVNQEAHVLRHFDRAGKLIESAFPQSRFSSIQRYRIDTSLLVAAQDRVGWYGPRYGNGAFYTEILVGTMTIREYPAASRTQSKWKQVEGLAMTNNGFTSVCIDDDMTQGVRTNYVLDRSSSTWVPVYVPPMGGFKFTPFLIGSDQDNLVFRYGRESGFFSISQ